MPDFEPPERREKTGTVAAVGPTRQPVVSSTRLQRVMTVGAASDPLEAEADQVAASVVSWLARGPAVSKATSRIRRASTPTTPDIPAAGQRIRRFAAATAGPASVIRSTGIRRRSNVVRRYIVPQVTIPGMAGPLDTTQLDAAKGLIDQLFNSGRRDSLLTLFSEILQHDATNRTLKDHITTYVKGTPSDEPANATSGLGEKLALTAKYVFADTSDLGVQAGLRMWVSGDPTHGIGWKMICNHLRGLLVAHDYEQVGTLHYLIEDQNNHTNLEPTYTNPQRVLAAQQVLDNAVQTINGALAALPAHDNVSYRQSGVATATTYGTTIRVGDVIRDAAFWSTSALRISGSAGGWGTNGTLAAPKVYFLITGSTGKYISKHAAQEEGQHEVLFSNNICFRVDRIANYGSHTIFVSITEVAAVGLNLAKNPYDGSPA